MRIDSHTAIAAALGLALALGASSARAGVTIINACTTITNPGEYALQSDLTLPAGPGICLTLDASYVVLNLNGHRLACSGSGSGGIITASGLQGIAIFNGIISGCDIALDVGNDEALVQNVRVYGPGTAGIQAGPGSTVRYDIAHGFGSGGIGIHVRCPVNVIGNTATGNTANFISSDPGCNVTADNLLP